jgi:hypothetical protein
VFCAADLHGNVPVDSALDHVRDTRAAKIVEQNFALNPGGLQKVAPQLPEVANGPIRKVPGEDVILALFPFAAHQEQLAHPGVMGPPRPSSFLVSSLSSRTMPWMKSHWRTFRLTSSPRRLAMLYPTSIMARSQSGGFTAQI